MSKSLDDILFNRSCFGRWLRTPSKLCIHCIRRNECQEAESIAYQDRLDRAARRRAKKAGG
jgi:hypothetical protein